jgi:hypothetical protein
VPDSPPPPSSSPTANVPAAYRDADNRVHGPGGPVFMGRGEPRTDKLDHGLRPGVWFAADNVVSGKMFRALPVFEFENAWWSWRGEKTEPKRLFRTAVVTQPEQVKVGEPVVFFAEEGRHKFLDNEYDMLTSSRWLVAVVDTVSATSVRIRGWDEVPIETVRVIVEEKPAAP